MADQKTRTYADELAEQVSLRALLDSLGASGVGSAMGAVPTIPRAVVTSAPVATTEGPDTIVGTSGPDTIDGLGGDDRITGAGGDDRIEGGSGLDTAVYSGPHGRYQILPDAAGATLVTDGRAGAPDGQDRLTGIEVLEFADAAIALRIGTAGNDTLAGTDGIDAFELQQGGNDAASGGGGDDTFFLGDGLTTDDRIDGGLGTDQIGLRGSQAVVLGDMTIRGIETIALLESSVSAAPFSYSITTANGNAPAGGELTLWWAGLARGESVTVDASRQIDGAIRTFAGQGDDTIIGSARDDSFYFGDGAFTAADRIDAGSGSRDQLALQGDYGAGLTLGAQSLVGVETLAFLPGGAYDITSVDANVAAGKMLTLYGVELAAGEHFRFDGTAERDGSFTFFGSPGNDVLIGGARADTFYGLGGGDRLTGGGGADRFVLTGSSETGSGTPDVLVDFDPREDRIVLSDVVGSVPVTAIDPGVAGALRAAQVDADLTAALGAGQLGAHHAVLFTATGSDTGYGSYLVIDGNGVAGYQAGQDYVIALAAPMAAPLTIAAFEGSEPPVAAITMALVATDRVGDAADITSSGMVTLTGKAASGQQIALFDAAGTQVATTLAAVDGSYRFTEIGLHAGDNDFTVRSFAAGVQTAQATLDVHRVAGDAGGAAVLDVMAAATLAVMQQASTPLYASRALAMVGEAVLETVNAINGLPGFQFGTAAPAGASANAAIAQVGHDVLLSLFPGSAAMLNARLAAALAAVPDGAGESSGSALGAAVAARVLASRASDGWDDTSTYLGSNTPGAWQPTPDMYAPGLDPHWGQLPTFVLPDAIGFDPGAPPVLGSPEWIAAFNELKAIGGADSTVRTAEQSLIARFWGLGTGTVTPPGVWVDIAARVAAEQGLGAAEAARLFGQLGLALGDAGIASWATKYEYATWRPVTAIQNAGTLGIADLAEDRDWESYIVTPNFPEYTSGHSTFSGAAATILTDFFGGSYRFDVTTPTQPGVSRSFASFWDAANEAGMSRIYGGIHFSFSNDAGKEQGSDVARYVLGVFDGSTDLLAPRLFLDAAAGAVVSGADARIAGAVTDDLAGVAGLYWSLDGSAPRALELSPVGDFTLSLSGLSAGAHAVSLQAVDGTGKIGGTTVNFAIAATPVFALASAGLENGEVLTGTSRLIGQVDPGIGNAITSLSYSVDGGQARAVRFTDDGRFDAALDTGDIAPGAHQLRLAATDSAGHSIVQMLNVTSAALPFTVTDLRPTASEMAVGVTFRPFVQFSRPVDPATFDTASFYATDSSGRVVPATLVPFNDGRGGWLLFREALPGSSEITLHLEGDRLRSIDHVALSGDGSTAGSDLTTSFHTVSTTAVPGTTITGIVLDPGADYQPLTADDVKAGPRGLNDYASNTYKLPLAGVKVYLLGHEDQAVLTDAQGRFTLTSVPGGHVMLAVDGRTATNVPAGTFFPEMVMDLTVKPGVANTVMDAMGSTDAQVSNIGNQAVYLPRIASVGLTPVAADAPTVVRSVDTGGSVLAENQLSLVSLTVQPGSQVGADGRAVAAPMVAVAPVPTSLVMDMLPPGVLQHTFDITIQAPGTSVFTQEAVLTLPNTFDLAPGQKVYVLSFDHTTGRLVINGTATVSADGQTVTTDPGSGIRAPGWHGITGSMTEGGGSVYRPCIAPPTGADDDGITGEDVQNAMLNVAGHVSTVDSVTDFIEPLAGGGTRVVKGALGAAGLISDSSGILDTLTQIETAKFAGDTGGYGPPDTGYYAIMGFKLLGQIAKTAGDALGAIADVAPFLEGTSIAETQGFLNKATNAADIFGTYLAGDTPFDPTVALANKIIDYTLTPPRATSKWSPPANPKSPAAAQAVLDAIHRAETNFEGRKPFLEDFAHQMQVISEITGRAFGQDGKLDTTEVSDLLNERNALADAINKAALDAEGAARYGTAEADLDAVAGAFDNMLDAYALDLGASVEDMSMDDDTVIVDDNTIEYGSVFQYLLENLDTKDELRGSFDPMAGIKLALAPDTHYRLTIYDPLTGAVSFRQFLSAASGEPTDLGKIMLLSDSSAMGENGITLIASKVLGVDPNRTDNLVPGVPDAVALKQGLADAPQLANVNGVVAAVTLLGTPHELVVAAQGINAGGLLAYVATGEHGLAIVDVGTARMPAILAQLDLPGDATDLVVDSSLKIAAVATGQGGLQFIDIADSAAPRVLATNAMVTGEVEYARGIVYASGSDGSLRAFDLVTGDPMGGRLPDGAAIVSMAAAGDQLYTIDAQTVLRVYTLDGHGRIVLTATLDLRGAINPGDYEITVGDGVLFVATASGDRYGGFATVTVADPAHPVLLSNADNVNVAGAHLALDGSGHAVGIQTVLLQNAGGTFEPRNLLDVIDVSDPANTGVLRTRYDLSGAAQDVAIARGFAYALAGDQLQVVRFAPVDLGGVAPTISVIAPPDADANTPGLQLREGERTSFAVDVADDVSVRDVQMLVNGIAVATGVSFPFALSAVLPTIAANDGATILSVSFRATDTGGNVGTTAPISVQLVRDTTPLAIVSSVPADEGVAANGLRSLTVDFSKPLDVATLTPANFQLVGAGGTALTPLRIEPRNGDRQVKITYEGLQGGDYDLVIQGAQVKDLAGNALGAADSVIDFTVRSFTTQWIGGPSGRWSDAANWSKGAVPGAGDDVYVLVGENGDVRYDAASPSVASLTVAGSGPLTISPVIFNGEYPPLVTGALRNVGIVTVTTRGELDAGLIDNAGTLTVAPTGTMLTTGNIDNRGEIVLLAQGTTSATWRLRGTDVHLTGGGTIRMDAGPTDGSHFYGPYFAGKALSDGFDLQVPSIVTNDDNVIIGSGEIGGPMNLTNDGEIRAAGGRLAINLYRFSISNNTVNYGSGTLVNHGLMSAGEYAQLAFSALGQLVVDNTGGLITADGLGSQLRFGYGTYSGGTILATAIGSSIVGTEHSAGSGPTFRDVTIDTRGGDGMRGNLIFDGGGTGIVFAGSIRLGADDTLRFAGKVENAGAWQARGNAGYVHGFEMTGDTLLSGGGSLTLASDTDLAYLVVSKRDAGYTIDPATGEEIPLPPPPPFRLVNSDNVIGGGGVIGGLATSNNGGLGNDNVGIESFILENRADGVIEGARRVPDSSGTPVAQPLILDGLTIVNQGIVRATDGGAVELLYSQLDNAGGLLRADNGSAVRLNNAATLDSDLAGLPAMAGIVSGGRVEIGEAAEMVIQGGTQFRDVSVSIDGGGTLVVQHYQDAGSGSGGSLQLGGTIENSGTIRIEAGEFGATGLALDSQLRIFQYSLTGDETVLTLSGDGGGQLVLASNADGIGTASLISDGGDRLYVLANENNDVHGTGVLGDAGMEIRNGTDGRIGAQEADRLTVSAATIVNDGTLRIDRNTVSDADLLITGDVTNRRDIIDEGAGTLRIEGRLDNQGYVLAADGEMLFSGLVDNSQTIEARNGGILHFAGEATGGGGYKASAGAGTLIFDHAFDAVVELYDGDGRVQIGDAAAFTGEIRGFGTGDTIALDQFDATAAYTMDDRTIDGERTLVVTQGQLVATLHLVDASTTTVGVTTDLLDGHGLLLIG